MIVRPFRGVTATLASAAQDSACRVVGENVGKSASRIWTYDRVLLTFGAQAVSTVTPGKSPLNTKPHLSLCPRAGWAPTQMVDGTGTNGMIEPGPVSGVWR